MTTDTKPEVHYRILTGNLTRDPELRFSAKGNAWCAAGLAVNRRKRLDDGTYEELPAEFYDLVTFGDLAENVAELAKGTRVIAFGKVEHGTWTAKDGTERETVKLLADEVGASLRFASVEVHRTSREGPAERPASADDGFGYDDEPF